MTSYDHVPLGEICTINPRTRTPACSADTPVTFVPMAAVDARTGTIAVRKDRPLAEVQNGSTAFQDGDVLFAKITPCMQNGKAALARGLTNGLGRGSTEFYVLRPRDRVLGEYIWHFVRQPRFRDAAQRSFTGTAGQQRVPRSFVENVRVPLPPLDEQRRIVDILNRAARIEALRRRAAERLREFVPALFVKMFGDPVENPMGWKVRSLADLVQEFRYGTSRKCYYDPASDENAIPVLRIPNILQGHVDWTDLKYTSLPATERSNLNLEPGDILFVRSNGNPDYIGRCAVFRDRRPAAYASYLIQARLRRDGDVSPEYAANALSLPTTRQTIARMARTTAGNYNINIHNLGRVQIPCPELKRQQMFVNCVTKLRTIASTTTTASRVSSDVLLSLTSHLFGPA